MKGQKFVIECTNFAFGEHNDMCIIVHPQVYSVSKGFPVYCATND